MIGSFWNLCRACPSMPEDKLHSEYRSTYRWHEYTGNNRAEVIKKPPATNQFASSADHFFSKSTEEERHVEGVINEPPLPRRKKCPELAYRTHEFITGETRTKNDINASTYSGRARSEERGGTPSRRSKSEGPYRIPNGEAYPIGDTVDKPNGHPKTGSKAGESNGLFRKTISKLSTEYRIQFIWPHTRKDRKRGDDEIDIPKKSLSMGAIKAAHSNAMPTVHKKRTIYEKEASTQELEPLCPEEKPEKKSEFPAKKSVRPFSQYAYDTKFKHGRTEKENFGFAGDDENKIDNKTLFNGGHVAQTWYRDVVELRKKAEEYKNRGWGTEINPDLYKKQKDLWDQVSRRSSLSALSLASAVHKPITKEEKEAANNKNVSAKSPIKNVSVKNVSQIHFIDNKLIHDAAIPARALYIRHHLGRTTGLDMEDGALLPSPTRDKLMPTIPKSKDDESYNSQRGSPKKSAISRHGSPQKGSPQKMQKKTIKQTDRSQSVGPNVDGSPKRQVRSSSAAPATTASTKVAKKTPISTPTIVERRPRPTTLSTSNHYRSKSSSLPPTGRAHSTTPGSHQTQNFAPNNTQKLSSPSQNTIPVDPSNPNQRIPSKTTKQRPQSAIVMGTFDPMTASTIIFNDSQKVTNQDKKTARNEDDTDKDGVTSLSSASPIPAHEIYEHIVKSPPEPTRVKSPEQILMRSPDPVNWVVPLDTGKTFTVTQNIRNGDPIARPQSEFKVSTPVDKPPSAPFSAPPNVIEQAKMEAWKNEKLEETLPIKEPAHTTSIISAAPYDKPIPGSTLRRLDDPVFDTALDVTAATLKERPAATDDLNEARDRFDRFWGCNKDKEEEKI